MNEQTIENERGWIDFYALLDVPMDASEETLRRRIGRVYAEAAANSDHRDLHRRHYFQLLVEQVLPQCRRILLDASSRAKYNHQHALHAQSNGAAQDYMTFCAALRGVEAPQDSGEWSTLPQKVQEEMSAAQAVVKAARTGVELDLLPSTSTSVVPSADVAQQTPSARSASANSKSSAVVAQPAAQPEVPAKAARAEKKPTVPLEVGSTPGGGAFVYSPLAQERRQERQQDCVQNTSPEVATSSDSEEACEPKTELRAQVLTVAEASQRRRQAHTPSLQVPVHSPEPTTDLATDSATEHFADERRSTPRATSVTSVEQAIGGDVIVTQHARKGGTVSHKGAAVGTTARRKAARGGRSAGHNSERRRVLSPPMFNLVVSVTGALLFTVIQHTASTPVVATSDSRTPLLVVASPEIEPVLTLAESRWENSPAGGRFDLVVSNASGQNGMRRALGRGGTTPDLWMPSNALWVERYNAMASKSNASPTGDGGVVAQTPIVLIARSERAGELRRRFPDHRIKSWSALQAAVRASAPGRLGLAAPETSAAGALARYSIAREWGDARGRSVAQVTQSGSFWKWMRTWEDNVPTRSTSATAAVKDMALGTTGRFWWVVGYESDALSWMNDGKPLEIFYLPRTVFADHPLCSIERTGASVEVTRGRAEFIRFLRSDEGQKLLLRGGFRPTEISPTVAVEGNPFTNKRLHERGLRVENLPRDERVDAGDLQKLESEWARRIG